MAFRPVNYTPALPQAPLAFSTFPGVTTAVQELARSISVELTQHAFAINQFTVAPTSTFLDLVAAAVPGDILVRGTTDWTLLPVGATGTVLGGGALPTWVTPPASRLLLAAPMEIWVNRTGGNDSNLGTVGSPLLTIPEAVRRAAAVDNNGNAITIKVKAGTYPETVGLISFLGSGTITIIGVDTTWPTAPSASITGGISASHLVGSYVIDNLNLTGGTSRNNIFLVNSTLTYQNIEFGTSANNIVSFFGSIAIGTGPTSIIQSTGSHWQCAKRGMVEDDGNRITIPNVIEVKIFAFSLESSTVICGADTFITTYSGAGSAPTMTGSSKRFQVIDAQSNISTQGSDPLTYLPGNVPGTAPAGSYF